MNTNVTVKIYHDSEQGGWMVTSSSGSNEPSEHMGPFEHYEQAVAELYNDSCG